MLGSKRVTTRDVDINVLSFPEFPEDPMIKARFPFDDDNSIMKITYLDPKEAVKADVATRRAQHIPLLLKYSLTDPKTNFTYANYQLLLADKIRTLAERGECKDKKRETDLADIKFCIEEMFMRDEKMPEDLKFLYSVEDWGKVLEYLKGEEEHEGACAFRRATVIIDYARYVRRLHRFRHRSGALKGAHECFVWFYSELYTCVIVPEFSVLEDFNEITCEGSIRYRSACKY
ncbi:uncharacterized protein LACBIDRAFT_333084 [Laccaria bicolor S238N-H82]|uniref:Predicted protein n=1 Tax=Laccaria bicolor (strain S238N-H82 / ATCC MYA-4686) TaxID=486041 RepID=B0DUT6_LACBS|nr:uncharacterized protein LACBIDRAFT_333084 [Laccaria bicolor S238N-H82]EDR01601.1 predicted protein [Laccaria bicolor S238N-H82]|eukprot:XP_001887677.1 predicted protein [Laccaria bicolor S238N-H82]